MGYGEDLALIHDSGFSRLAEGAAEVLLGELRRRKQTDGLIVDVGCGGGVLAEKLSRAGYEIIGFDQSTAMLELARRRIPHGEFRCESYRTALIPPCIAVTATGEIFNYLFDQRRTSTHVWRFFERVFRALEPGGLFLFDMAGPGRIPGGALRSFFEGDNWTCLVDASETPDGRSLTRRIVSFRKTGDGFRRSEEIHRLQLFPRSEVLARLRAAGFRAMTTTAYADFPFPPGLHGYLARKP